MKRNPPLQPTVTPHLIVELTKEERKALKSALSVRGSLILMSEKTGVHRDTITSIKTSGRGETRTVAPVLDYLVTRATERAQRSTVMVS
jgi:hypothetical protein